LLLLATLAVPGCAELGRWQLHRLDHARARNEQIRVNSRAAPTDMAAVSAVGGTIPRDLVWRSLSVTGRYDNVHTLLVRNRSRDGAPGFHVLTPLLTEAGPAALIDRGWLAAPEAGSAPALPETPVGTVRVTGLLRPTETQPRRGPHDAADTPAGQVVRIDVPRISRTLAYPVYSGYVDLRTQQPPASVVDGASVPDPNPLPGSETELLHLAYAWQWFVFAGIAPLGFVLLVRREAAELARPRAVGRSALTGA